MDNLLIRFTQMHDQYILDWNTAMSTGDTSSIERIMAEDYYCAFFNGPKDKPMIFNREDAISGMKESVNQLIGGKKKFENRVIRLKNPEHAAVFSELTVEKDDKVVAKFFTIENWQLVDDKWLLARETEEPIR